MRIEIMYWTETNLSAYARGCCEYIRPIEKSRTVVHPETIEEKQELFTRILNLKPFIGDLIDTIHQLSARLAAEHASLLFDRYLLDVGVYAKTNWFLRLFQSTPKIPPSQEELERMYRNQRSSCFFVINELYNMPTDFALFYTPIDLDVYEAVIKFADFRISVLEDHETECEELSGLLDD